MKSNVLYILIPAVLVVRALLVSVPVAIAFCRFASTGLCRLRFDSTGLCRLLFASFVPNNLSSAPLSAADVAVIVCY